MRLLLRQLWLCRSKSRLQATRCKAQAPTALAMDKRASLGMTTGACCTPHTTTPSTPSKRPQPGGDSVRSTLRLPRAHDTMKTIITQSRFALALYPHFCALSMLHVLFSHLAFLPTSIS